jgi:hypothetical protein
MVSGAGIGKIFNGNELRARKRKCACPLRLKHQYVAGTRGGAKTPGNEGSFEGGKLDNLAAASGNAAGFHGRVQPLQTLF